MANQSVLELAVSTGKWDAGLKKAKDALNKFTDASGGLQNALGKDSQKMQQFVQMMGKMDSQAKTAKGQLNDYKSTIEQLTMQYNRMTDAQKKSIGQDYLNSIDKLKQKYQSVNKEIQDMNKSLLGTITTSNGSDTGKGGGNFGGMMQVFGGNVMTKLAGFGVELTSEIGQAINASAQLARQAEGVQIAFNRLGRGDILDGLREATHGTVSDLELMKAAVKFNDFKLPIEELGTMLAFAQQKAKDTGQSVDYMVDSIVTGLGRKSLMILDNLGLSASEIRDKMKETGDMTKAVGEIIREQMAKAGDYVETAADRAKQANVDLENAMLQLGNTMQEVTGFSGWDEMATKIKTEVVGALQFTIETIGEAKNAWNSFMQTLGIQDKPQKPQGYWKDKPADGTYWETTDEQGNVVASGRWLNGKQVKTGIGDVIVNGNLPDSNNKKSGSGGGSSIKKELTELQSNQQRINELTQEYVNISDQSTADVIARQVEIRKEIALLQARNNTLKLYSEQAQGKFLGGNVQTSELEGSQFRGFAAASLDVGAGLSPKVIEEINNSLTSQISILNQQQKAYGMAAQAAQNFGSAMAGIEDPAAKAAGQVTQAIASIALGFAMASSNANTAGTGWGWLAWLGAGMGAMATTIATIHSLTGFQNGGQVKKYANGGITDGTSGGSIIGTTYSNDQIPIMANAGEVILNKAQQSTLAQNLQGNGGGGMRVVGEIQGEKIVLVANRYFKRTGQGEIVTW